MSGVQVAPKRRLPPLPRRYPAAAAAAAFAAPGALNNHSCWCARMTPAGTSSASLPPSRHLAVFWLALTIRDPSSLWPPTLLQTSVFGWWVSHFTKACPSRTRLGRHRGPARAQAHGGSAAGLPHGRAHQGPPPPPRASHRASQPRSLRVLWGVGGDGWGAATRGGAAMLGVGKPTACIVY
jgi:hypothetical protein